MSNVTNPTLFRALDELINAQNRHIKWASDGFNSSMPEDENDHLTEPSEGSHISEMDSDLKNADSGISNVEEISDASYSEDGQDEQSLSSQEVMEADEGERDYEFGHDDPGTSMPASADNNSDKYASYDFATNFAAFNKLASAFENGASAQTQQPQKAAAYQPSRNDDPELVQKALYTIDLANENAQIFQKLASYSFKKLAEGEDVSPEDVVPVLDNVDGAEELPADDVSPEEAASAIEAIQDPEDQAAIEEIVEAVENGEISPEELDALLAEADAEDTEEKIASYQKCAAYSNAISYAHSALSQLPAQDAVTIANLPFNKLAELVDEIDADAGAGELTPEEEAALDSLSDDELEALIEIANGLETGEISPEEVEAIASEGDAAEEVAADPSLGSDTDTSGDDISDDDALNELSSAMVEQGVSPDDLENAEDVPEEKQAMVHKLASAVRGFRNSGKFQYKQAKAGTKQAQARSLFHQFLNEFLNR